MILCPICLDLGFYPIFDMDGEQRYSIDCPDCGGASVEERGGTSELESPKSMQTLWAHEVHEVRRGRVEYGEVFPVVLTRRAFCRCCGQSMPKGTKAIRFGWDFKGCGSWTVVECSMHAEPCTAARVHSKEPV